HGELTREELRHEGEDRLLVVDHQQRGRRLGAHVFSADNAGGSTGRRTTKVAPRPRALCSWMSPPWRATSECAMASPSPVPLPTALVVKNGSKMRSQSSGAIPGPLSLTSTNTLPFSAYVRKRISPCPSRSEERRVGKGLWFWLAPAPYMRM